MHLSEEVRLLTAKLKAADDKTQAKLAQVSWHALPVFLLLLQAILFRNRLGSQRVQTLLPFILCVRNPRTAISPCFLSSALRAELVSGFVRVKENS